MIIDEKKVAELRLNDEWNGDEEEAVCDTLEALWRVTNVARQYHMHPEFHSMCALCIALAALDEQEKKG